MDPVPLGFEFQTGLDRYRAVLGHYDLRVYLAEESWIDADRGSFDAAYRIRGVRRNQGCLGHIGQWCEFADTPLLAVGEHPNESPVNSVFASVPLFLHRIHGESLSELQPRTTPPISIGDNVVISVGAHVLPGVKISDGSVIGAGAIVTTDVEPFSIYAGIPARKIRDRFEPAALAAVRDARWWDFETSYLYENLQDLQRLASGPGRHVYRQRHPRIAIRLPWGPADNGRYAVLGIVEDDELVPLARAPAPVRAYVDQLADLQPLTWIANVWTQK